MCGRVAIEPEQIVPAVEAQTGVRLQVPDNPDFRPSELSQLLAGGPNGLRGIAMQWGIQPSWARQLLINAQLETVQEKPTFRRAFAQRRCVFPVSGWFEWKREEGQRGPQKYSFRSASGGPLYLGAIWYPLEEAPDVGSFVVLTQEPTPQCAAYHSRMPVLLQPSRLRDWVQSPLPKLHIPSVGSTPPLAITPVGRSAPDPAQATLF